MEGHVWRLRGNTIFSVCVNSGQEEIKSRLSPSEVLRKVRFVFSDFGLCA